jgi:hypothetical protein
MPCKWDQWGGAAGRGFDVQLAADTTGVSDVVARHCEALCSCVHKPGPAILHIFRLLLVNAPHIDLCMHKCTNAGCCWHGWTHLVACLCKLDGVASTARECVNHHPTCTQLSLVCSNHLGCHRVPTLQGRSERGAEAGREMWVGLLTQDMC